MTTVLVLGFQNCSEVRFSDAAKYRVVDDHGVTSTETATAGEFGSGDSRDTETPGVSQPLPPLACGGTNNPCELTPLVARPGVVTILLALGDQFNNQLTVRGASAQLIAEGAVRYASPVSAPKILVVRDANHNNESTFDPEYIARVLLQRYHALFIEEPAGGLTPSHVQGYDLIWFNNPGHAMGSRVSYETLLGFSGGVVLSGDDMARGRDFSMTALTGLNYINNGVEVVCGDESYIHDNNSGYQYTVTLDGSAMTGVPNSEFKFTYGNDIDLTRADSTVEVIATAVGGGEGCREARPVIVRYEK